MNHKFKEIPPIFWFGFGQATMSIFNHTLGILRTIFPGNIFATDHLVTIGRNMGFLHDPEFRSIVDKNEHNPTELAIIWRTHIVTWAAKSCLSLEGDFVECGVLEGYTARIVTEYTQLHNTSKQYYLYDLFEPLDADGVGHSHPQLAEGLYEKVKQRFSDIPNVKVIKGKIPEIFVEVLPQRIAFMHVDLNNAEAEHAALEGLWGRVVNGGIVVFDDYGWAGPYAGQKVAIDRFMQARGHQVVELPTGQGMVVKRGVEHAGY